MEFDKKYKVYTWKNWMILHYILNPGIAVNEIIFGQRVPKVSLEDTTSDKPMIERSYVPCPHCHELHDGRTWSIDNGTAFKNWFGLYCRNCGEIIPCLINLTTLIILAITFPIWGWFKNDLKRRWLEKQPARFKEIAIEVDSNPYEGKKWIKTGLSWGLIMFLLISIGLPLLLNEGITLTAILIGAVLWTIGGLGFGYFMKRYFGKKGKHSTGSEPVAS